MTQNSGSISDFRRALPQFCVVGVKNLILLGWGLTLGYPTILIPGLQAKSDNANLNQTAANFVLSEEEMSWVGSINLLAVPLGSFTSGLLMDAIGKRRMMQILNLPMLAAWALFYFSTNITQIYIALCLSGMSGGLLEAPLLLYIAETVEPQYRGMLTASGTATVLGGVCLQFIMGSILHWKTVAAISAIIPFLAFNAVFIVPESPVWLYAKHRVDDAQRSLQWLRGWVPFKMVQEEFQDIAHAIEVLQEDKKARLIEQRTMASKLHPFTKRSFIAPFALVLSGFIFSHFSGMTPLQTYSIQILGSYRVPINEYYATICLGAAQVIGCLLGMVIVRLVGKRRLVFISFIGCGVCFFAVATQSHFSNESHQYQSTIKDNSLNTSIRHLEQNVQHTIMTIIRHYDKLNHAEIQRIAMNDSYLESLNEYHNILFKFLNSTAEMNKSTIFQIDRKEYADFFEDANTLHQINSNELSNRKDISLLELLNIIRHIILPFFKNDTDVTNIAQLIEQIKRDERLSNHTADDASHLADKINELSATLSNIGLNHIYGIEAVDENGAANTYRWMPLILLLLGSMFAHCGAKLFPWMLIGEVYPMDVRSTAAGISSMFGYLVGFLSNKLFQGTVDLLTLNGTFWFYSSVSIVGCGVLFFILPETENKTLHEIQECFVRKTHVTQNNPNSKLRK